MKNLLVSCRVLFQRSTGINVYILRFSSEFSPETRGLDFEALLVLTLEILKAQITIIQPSAVINYLKAVFFAQLKNNYFTVT